jgi:hypothetical protein
MSKVNQYGAISGGKHAVRASAVVDITAELCAPHN